MNFGFNIMILRLVILTLTLTNESSSLSLFNSQPYVSIVLSYSLNNLQSIITYVNVVKNVYIIIQKIFCYFCSFLSHFGGVIKEVLILKL